jgi:hypothetical protein
VACGRVDLSFVRRCSLGLLYRDPALAFANSAARDGSLARLCVLDDPNTSAITRFAFDFVCQGAPRFRVIERPEGVWKKSGGSRRPIKNFDYIPKGERV